jgi:hypothetical protein
MPIQVGGALDLKQRQGAPVVIVHDLPWEMIEGEASERQAMKNHDQTLDELRARAGVSACEAVAILSNLPWSDLGGDEKAHRILYAMRHLFMRGQRIAEARQTQPAT